MDKDKPSTPSDGEGLDGDEGEEAVDAGRNGTIDRDAQRSSDAAALCGIGRCEKGAELPRSTRCGGGGVSAVLCRGLRLRWHCACPTNLLVARNIGHRCILGAHQRVPRRASYSKREYRRRRRQAAD